MRFLDQSEISKKVLNWKFISKRAGKYFSAAQAVLFYLFFLLLLLGGNENFPKMNSIDYLMGFGVLFFSFSSFGN